MGFMTQDTPLQELCSQVTLLINDQPHISRHTPITTPDNPVVSAYAAQQLQKNSDLHVFIQWLH